jgi:hypothetical protein
MSLFSNILIGNVFNRSTRYVLVSLHVCYTGF